MRRRRNSILEETIYNQSSSGKLLKLSKRKLFLILTFLFLVSCFLGFKLFAVSEIEVSLNNVDCVGENVIKTSNQILGKNIFLVKQGQVEADLKLKYLCIKSANLEKTYPNKIKLDLNSRQSAAILNIKAEVPKLLTLDNLEATPSSQAAILDVNFNDLQVDKRVIVDDAGFAFSNQVEGVNLPVIFLSDHELDLGKTAKGEIKDALGILNKLKSSNLQLQESKIANSIFIINGKQRIIFDLNKDPTKQVASLQLILQKATMESKELSLVDLRFDKPVVKYSGKK